jgi:hypothetical protein
MSCNQDYLDSVKGVVEINGMRYYPAELVEEKLIAIKSTSPKFPTLAESVEYLQGHFGKELDAAQYSIVDHLHDYMCSNL